MKISLIRHGRPAVDFSSRIRAADFPAWLDAYEAVGLDRSLPPPAQLAAALAGCGRVIVSPVRRALESAELLQLPAETVVLPAAAEVPLPTRLYWPFRLRPGTMIVTMRILWSLGLGQAREDKQQAAIRVRQLAHDLERHAQERSHVVMVGHGYTHYLLGKALTVEGWRAATQRRHGYWSCSHYEKVRRP